MIQLNKLSGKVHSSAAMFSNFNQLYLLHQGQIDLSVVLQSHRERGQWEGGGGAPGPHHFQEQKFFSHVKLENIKFS